MKNITLTCLIAAISLFAVQSAFSSTFKVTKVEDWDTLNVRASFSSKSEVVTKLPYNATGLKATGKTKKNGKTTWMQIVWKGKTGWVSKRYIAAELPKTVASGTKADKSSKAPIAGAKPEKKAPAKVPATAQKKPAPVATASKQAPQGRNIKITEKVVGNVKDKKIRKPQKSVGQWVLQCGNTIPSWVVQVYPKHLELEMDGQQKVNVPITAKHQEKSVYNTALKTLVKGRNQAHNVSLDITFTRNCLDPFINQKVPYAVKANYNGSVVSGCCRAVRVD